MSVLNVLKNKPGNNNLVQGSNSRFLGKSPTDYAMGAIVDEVLTLMETAMKLLYITMKTLRIL